MSFSIKAHMGLLSGLDLCILSSSPVVLSYLFQVLFLKELLSTILSLKIVSNWDKQSWFPVRYFSEYELCVDEDLSGLSVDRHRRLSHCF